MLVIHYTELFVSDPKSKLYVSDPNSLYVSDPTKYMWVIQMNCMWVIHEKDVYTDPSVLCIE